MAVLDAAAAAQLVPAGLPVLVIDTCSLLDIPRVLERERKPAPEIEAARHVLVAAQARPRRVALFVAERVLSEWATNKPGVIAKLDAHVARVEEDLARIAACARPLGLAPMAATELHAMRLPHLLLEIAEAILQEATVIEETEPIKLAAYMREIRGTGPAKRGKQCLSDCTIAESLLGLTAGLRTRSSAALVFLTSNKEDFSDGGSQPHPDLQGDFARLVIQLNFRWAWAVHSLAL
jgi:hypothetical protein